MDRLKYAKYTGMVCCLCYIASLEFTTNVPDYVVAEVDV